MRGWIGRRCMGKRKAVYWILLALIMVTVTGCGYTLEEKREMKRYEKQGRENAKNYIREKLGNFPVIVLLKDRVDENKKRK